MFTPKYLSRFDPSVNLCNWEDPKTVIANKKRRFDPIVPFMTKLYQLCHFIANALKWQYERYIIGFTTKLSSAS